MKRVVLTVIGEDKPGLVERLSNVLVKNNANWLASNLSHLSGFFAGVVEIEVPEEHFAALDSALNEIKELKVEAHTGVESSEQASQEIEFVITGNDRSGIVQELSSVISHKGASIQNFVSSKQGAPNWGGSLFHAVAKVKLPSGMSADVIAEALEQLASDIVVDLDSNH